MKTCTGQDLQKGDPALVLRNRLIKESRESLGHLKREDVLVAAIKSWNEYSAGRTISKIMIGLREQDSFPEFVGVR